MSGFEERYRKKNPGDAATAADASSAIEVLKAAAKEEYKPANTSAHPELDLWVRVNDRNANADVAVPYSLRNHMVYDGEGFVISLHFNSPVMCVLLRGRNLGDVFRKLLKREVEWIMEFDARKWETPAEDAPCITQIEITRSPAPQRTADDDGSLPGEKKPVDKAAMH